MKETAAGPYLDAYAGFLKQGKGTKTTGEFAIVYVRQGNYARTSLTMTSCEDGTRVKSYRTKDGSYLDKGSLRTLVLEFRHIDSKWKVWNGTDKKVSSCQA